MSALNWKPFVYGGLASVTAECESLIGQILIEIVSGTFPIDLTKTRLQIQGQKNDANFKEIRYRGMLHALVRIGREEGLKALYSGIAPAMLRQASYGTIKIGTYQSLKRLFVEHPEAQRAAIVVGVELPVYDLTKKHLILSGLMGDTVYTHFLSSFTCGLAGALASNPVDVVRTRMMNQRVLRDSRCPGYTGTLDCLLQLPIEDLCSLTSRSLPIAHSSIVPESTEDILLKGFTSLEMKEERIETAQQFFSWFAKLQTQMDQDEETKYRQMRDYLSGFQEQCDAILNDVNSALQHLESLQKQYLFVSNKTGTLHEACEQLLKEQPNFKDYPVYLLKFKQCLSKALHLMKAYTVNTLQNLTNQLLKRDPSSVPNADNAFTLFYVRFRAAAPKVRTLIEQIEQRSERIPEYQQLLNDIHQCYLDQRELLLGPSITCTVTELTSQNNRDHCALIRSGCAFMVHVCQDEHQLYNEFFTKPTSKLDELLEKLCVSLYDVFRPLIIHVIHLETLSELCGILKNEVLEDHVQNNAEQLGAFAAGVKQMLEDVQERLVYRTHIYIQTDITGYKPAPGDLAYPDKLVMMEQIAQSLKDEQKKVPSESSFSDVRLEEAESPNNLTKSDAAFKILNPMTVPRFFRLNSNNALIEFLLEGTPEIREHYLDSKKDVDRHLKSACEQFIQQQTTLFIEQLEEFMTKVGDLVASAYKTIKAKLPLTLRSMSLYLSNKDTEFILFKPVRNNIQQIFQKFHVLLKEEFSPEDIQIIACPSMEQVAVFKMNKPFVKDSNSDP
ncbi:conserved oligomeric Golgi complex subunit 3 isoform 1 [Camelus ferus]|nr:conserved oligomeric Golgi complex subunit 3 isoform 1 [Camelus ferus]